MSSDDNNLIVMEAVSKFRLVVQQLMALHLKRQRDHIARLRQQFFTKLSRRLTQNYHVYRRKRQQLEEDIMALAQGRAPRLNRHTYNRGFLNTFTSELAHPFNDEQLNTLRLDSECFGFLCEKLKDELYPGPAPPTIDEPLTLEKKIAIALYVLGSGANYRMAAQKFNIHFTTVRRCLYKFCQAMMKTFNKSELSLPTDAEGLDGAMKEFEDFFGIPQVMGIIDCLHIPISLPGGNETIEHINRNGWGSIVLQAIVDRQGRFMDISCSHPGRLNDETVLLKTSIYQRLEEQAHPFNSTRLVDGKEVQPFLIGDQAYPLLPWLITPYLAFERSRTDYSFNVYLSKGRNVIATAFERLTGRWKLLNRCLHTDINTVPDIVTTCCILHNIAERHSSPYRESWSECATMEDVTPKQPQWTCGIVTTEGEDVRNHLADYMVKHFPSIEDDDD